MTLNQSNLLIEAGTSYSIDRQPGDHPRRAHDQDRRRDPARSRQRGRSGGRFRRRNLCGSTGTCSHNRVDNVAITGGAPVLGTRKWYYYALRAGRLESAAEPDTEPRLAVRVLRSQQGSERPLSGLRYVRMQRFLPAGHAVVFPGPQQLRSAARHRLERSGKTVIRTGAGIYHGPGPDRRREHGARQHGRALLADHARSARALAIPLRRSWRRRRRRASHRARLQRDRRDLYSTQWGLSIQRELAGRLRRPDRLRRAAPA